MAHCNCIFKNKTKQRLKFGRNLFSRVFYKFYFSLRKSGCHPPFTCALLDDFDGGLNLLPALPAAGYVPSLGRKFGRQPPNSPQDNAIKI